MSRARVRAGGTGHDARFTAGRFRAVCVPAAVGPTTGAAPHGSTADRGYRGFSPALFNNAATSAAS